jgi:hypothetical protein
MNPAVSIKDFQKARERMEMIVLETMQNLEVAIYDPMLKFIFEKEVRNLIHQQFKTEHPDIDVKFQFSIYLSTQMIEYSVQQFYHPFSSHIFLGSIRDPSRGKGQEKPFLVDCYYSSLYECFGEPRIIVRHGNAKKEMTEGAESAARQFYSGMDTNLAKGYQLAIEAGYISS